MKIPPIWWLIGLLCACHSANARPETAPRRSVGHSTWLLEENLVTARLVLPSAEAASLVGKAMPLLSTESLAKYVLGKVSVTAGGSSCVPIDQGFDIGKINSLSLGSNLYGFEIIFHCSHGGALSLHNAVLFTEVPRHVDYARIEKGGVDATQLFTAARQDLAIPEHGDLPSAGAGRFLMLGAGHLWHSAARLCAILGFFLLARTRRQLATVLAALACGYATSLLLVAGGLIPDVALLEPGAGFVVACVAAVMVARSLRDEPAGGASRAVTIGACVLISSLLIGSIAAAWPHRPSVALGLSGFAIVGIALTGGGRLLPLLVLPAVAGVIDGLVLPGDYARLRQWGEVSSSNLAAFDAGALLSEALLLAAFAAAAAFMAGRASKQGIRPASFAPLAGDIAASVFAAFGSFWLLSTLY